MTTRWRITICGKVQGVYYRKSTQQKATELGLLGWVRNLDNGCVEAEAEGSVELLNALVEWCETGPPAAVVTSVQKEAIELEGGSIFTIRY